MKSNGVLLVEKPINLKLKKDEIKSDIIIFLPKTSYNLKRYFVGRKEEIKTLLDRNKKKPIVSQNFEEFFKDKN